MDENWSILHQILFLLVVIGAINWGLIGAFNFNMIHNLFAGSTLNKRIVYGIVGLAGIYYLLNRNQFVC